jgi:superfamily II DNA or RNA helicase
MRKIPQTLHAVVRLTDTPLPQVKDLLVQIPGVRVYGREVLVPHHGLDLVQSAMESAQLALASAGWAGGRAPSAAPTAWNQVEQVLREEEEVRSFVLDGFLTEYQKDALCFSHGVDGVHLWHPTGSGKTLSGILWSLMVPGNVLVVTRAASRLQYGREIERYTHVRPYVLRPSSSLKKGAQTLSEYMSQSGRRIVVVGWEALTHNLDDLLSYTWTSAIYDESHRGKSSKRWQRIPLAELDGDSDQRAARIQEQETQARSRGGFITADDDGSRAMMVPVLNTAAAAAKVARNVRRRLLTTATPVKDRVRDLWGQLDLGEPDAWGSATVWMDRYCDRKPGLYGGYDTTGMSNEDELTERLTRIVHRIDYRDTHRMLPPKRRQSVYIAPEDQGRPTAGFPAELKRAAQRGPSALMECKLAQAASKKRKAVIQLVGDHVGSKQKVVIFTGRKRDVDELGKELRKKLKDVQVWAAHGGSTPTQRQQVVDDYMEHPGPCVLVGTGDAFGEAINLHDTDAALFVMLPWTPGQVRQWEGRFCRLGQKRPVVIYYVVAENSVDEHVADKLISKLPGVEKIAQDTELAEAKYAIGGIEDEDALVDSILSKLED